MCYFLLPITDGTPYLSLFIIWLIPLNSPLLESVCCTYTTLMHIRILFLISLIRTDPCLCLVYFIEEAIKGKGNKAPRLNTDTLSISPQLLVCTNNLADRT